MSKAFLNQVLDEIVDKIKKSEEFRKELNMEVNSAWFTKDAMKNAILNELKFTSKSLVKKFPHWYALTAKDQNDIINTVIDPAVDEWWEKIVKRATDLQAEFKAGQGKGTVFFFDKNSISIVIEAPGYNVKKQIGASSNFNQIRALYQKNVPDIFKEIGEAALNKLSSNTVNRIQTNITDSKTLKDKDKQLFNISEGGIDLDHITTVAKHRASALNSIINKHTKGKTAAGLPQAKKFLDDIILEFELLRKLDAQGNLSIYLKPRSKRENIADKEESTKYSNLINSVMERFNNTHNWPQDPGSNSQIETIEFLVLNRFNSKVKTSKTVAKKTTAKKVKASKTKASRTLKAKRKVKTNVINTLITKPKIPNMASQLPRATRRKQPAQNSTFSLLTLINRALPETVAKNMNLPRLKLRTGRLASSVKATDVTTTPQGFLSIGYTYMKAPYQTFEPGFKQGSVERDPRKLIDFSIREIATGLITDRFYTRRL